jgi:hypothetical protein
MNRAVLSILAGWLAASAQIAPPNPPSRSFPPPNAEHVETGEAQGSRGDRIRWRIRLLPLASFPDLPPPVVTQLAGRGCLIPQSFEAKQPENVVHGSFRAAGSEDWAVLCSSGGVTTLYVFFFGQFDSPIALRTQPDSAWLGAEPGNPVFGSSWGIAVRPLSELRSTPRLRRAIHNPDHDAIDDARLERSLTIHYFREGSWLDLQADNNSD